ncbi:MAG: acyl carrier protein [Nitrospirae bacterium]|nr:acyl carrier protein [Candidatus Manganitrophaceae bacterium]
MAEQLIDQALRHFIIENFLYGEKTAVLKDDDSLSEKGIVDSTGVLELISYVETEFEIAVNDEEIVPENFDSIANLTRYVQKKRSGDPHAA